ncbi:MAG: hypothetical protein R3B70_35380 [Polyangiaceae bacterium]
MSHSGSLDTSFFRARHSASPGEPGDAALGAALHEIWRRGLQAWPDLPVEDTAFATWLGERAPPDVAPSTWLAGLSAADALLACACTEGLPAALRAFETAFIAKTPAYLRALHPTPEIVAETQQRLREKLFVGDGDEPPRIRRYEARGSLEGWVRITAVRIALNLVAADKPAQVQPADADALARALVPASDPELELVRARYKDDFLAAFREAIVALSPRERALLRATFIERLTPARIGAMYGVHRTTAMRWIDTAQQEVLSGTRARLIERCRLSPSECDHLLSVVKTGLDASISSLLQTPT